MSILDSLTQGLLIGLGLFYKALWPILLGVLITALIETLIDQERLAGILGGRDLLSTGRPRPPVWPVPPALSGL